MSSAMPQALIEQVLSVQDGDVPEDPLGEKILDASFEQFRMIGIRRSSMEDIARRAGVGRVTIYRRFESKERLVQALLLRECRNGILAVDRAVANVDGVEEKVVEAYITAMDFVRHHPLILGLLRTEPDTILGLLTVRANLGLSIARMYVARLVRGARMGMGLPPDDEAEMQLGEVCARMVLSLVVTPKTCIPVDDPEGARNFARNHIVPMVTRDLSS